nr:SDR family NAD(P)-dependent oxidoreductase [Arthrobacter sp. 24S4-2]
MLHTTHAALPHLLKAAEDSPRRVADIVNISSIAGRVAWNGYGVYNLTKFGVNGFTESLRQEIIQRHVRVGVLEPGGVDTELGSHNNPQVRGEMIDPFYEQTGVLAPEDIADGVAYVVTRPPRLRRGALDHAHRPGLTPSPQPMGPTHGDLGRPSPPGRRLTCRRRGACHRPAHSVAAPHLSVRRQPAR